MSNRPRVKCQLVYLSIRRLRPRTARSSLWVRPSNLDHVDAGCAGEGGACSLAEVGGAVRCPADTRCEDWSGEGMNRGVRAAVSDAEEGADAAAPGCEVTSRFEVTRGHLKPSRPSLVPARPKVCTRHVRKPMRFLKNGVQVAVSDAGEGADAAAPGLQEAHPPCACISAAPIRVWP